MGVAALLIGAMAAQVPEGQAEPQATGSPQQAEDSQPIIVTGERVPRSLRDTASSVDVTTARRLEALSGADRIEQVLQQIPNVVFGGGDPPAIRGQDTNGVLQALPAFLGGARPRTTIQIDGRAVSFNELAFGTTGIWDVERIEVFRTPQTTTQGLNSIAGAIFIHSKDPTFEWEGHARAIAGNYRTRQASLATSGPIIRDQLAIRASADVRRGRPSSKIVDVTRGADPNNDDYSLLRLKLLGQPQAWPGSRFELTYAHTESLAPSLEGIRPPFRKRRDPLDNYGTFGTNVDSVTAVMELPATSRLRSSTTVTYGNAFIRRYNLPGFGETKTRSRDFSAEGLLDWNATENTRVVGGVSYWRLSLDQRIDLSRVIGIGEFEDKQRALGLFGEVTLRPLARTTLTAGLRYQRDRQDRSGAIGLVSGEIPLAYKRSFSAWLPKLSVAYDLADEFRIGALVQRAYNPGGTTLRLDTGRNEDFDPETLWNYEIFVRASSLDGSLNLSGNLFYTAFRDSQRLRLFTVILPGTQPPGVGLAELFNVPRARSLGAELTAEWRASHRLSLRSAIGLLETKITRTDVESDLFKGRQFARSPGFTASGSIDWKPVDSLRLSAQVRHHSSYYSDDRETESRRIGSATFLDGRAAWTRGRVTVSGYVRNLFDTFRLRFLFNPRTQVAALATADDPREVGLGIETTF